MTHAEFLRRVMRPAAAWAEMEAGVRTSPEAMRFLLAIAGQESECTHRYQVLASGNPGPARSFYQGEAMGGMILCVTSRTLDAKITAAGRRLCEAASVRPEAAHIWRAIEGHDGLAHGLARLLVLSDPAPLPARQEEAWRYYLRTWRPGAPRPEKWPRHWQAAGIAVAAETA